MKKLLSLLFLITIFLLPAIFSVQADTCSSTETYTFEKCSGINDVAPAIGYPKGTEMPIEYYIGTGLSLLFSLLGIIFLVLTIYAGIQWMTAQGNTSHVEKAKSTLVKAIAGLIICLSAYAITYFVMNMLQGSNSAVHSQLLFGF